jgi:phthalate 4,5-dioxygenase oxygenase subunit
MSLPSDQLHVSRWLQRTNYCAGMEGEIDSAHISFLHKEFVSQDAKLHAIASGRTNDGAPKLTLRNTDYGFSYGARRAFGDENIWRMTHWFAPMFSLIPMGPGEFRESNGRAWVPVDDDHTTTFSYWFRVDRPLGIDKDMLDSGDAIPPRRNRGRYTLLDGTVIDTFLPLGNKENDYLVDREAQRTINYSGISGANDQDRSVQESLRSIGVDHPGIVNRRREHLMATDVAIVTARNILIKMATDLQNGIEPNYPKNGSTWAVRAISKICSEEDFDNFVQSFADDIAAPSAYAVLQSAMQKDPV